MVIKILYADFQVLKIGVNIKPWWLLQIKYLA